MTANYETSTIIGARPQFIKAAAVSRAIAEHNRLASTSSPLTPNPIPITEVIIHTGQHYDDRMSAIFFEQLQIPDPDYNLNVGSGPHGQQTGDMLSGIEKILIKEKPDWVLVYGYTNSTLAGALAASKLHIKIAHVEAGLRSFNRRMPEEINRIVTDHLSDLLFCPSQTAVNNLAAEGITAGVRITGDVMFDAIKYAEAKINEYSTILKRLGLENKKYFLATVHRAENTDNEDRLISIMSALSALAEQGIVILPLHPRTKKMLENSKQPFKTNDSLKIIEPVGYFDMIALQQSARMILTDSGGMQKEAYWLKVPCITLRDETEWTETVEAGWNILTGADRERIIRLRIFSHSFELSRPLWERALSSLLRETTCQLIRCNYGKTQYELE